MMKPWRVVMGFLEFSKVSTPLSGALLIYYQLKNLVLYLKFICLGICCGILALRLLLETCTGTISTSFKTRSGCPESHPTFLDRVTSVGFILFRGHVIKRIYRVTMIVKINF